VADLELSVDVAAPAAVTWAAATDWDQQGGWMLGTRVRATDRAGVGVGGGVEAFTGVGRVGFLDTMVITAWSPPPADPARCDVRHTGRVVRGTGVFAVTALGTDRSRFTWSEHLVLPLGALGRVGWPLVRPLLRLGVQRSLDRFAAYAARRAA